MTDESHTNFTRVKFLSRQNPRVWRRQLPNQSEVWSGCKFIFDTEETNYDWLVVYDDLPPSAGERRPIRTETLSCPRGQTILVTSEPSSIKSYFTDYTDQFGFVMTSQPHWALPHRGHLYQQPALQWFYGIGSSDEIPFHELEKSVTGQKIGLVSAVGSGKRQTHTLHHARFEFLQALKERCPQIDFFGREDTLIDDKAEAVRPYFFHLAVENYIGPHHWTEKLADCFLGEAVPLYVGCPNIADYFPKESFIALDINNIKEAEKIINNLTVEDYQRRLPALKEAKRRVLYQYNIFSEISKIIEYSTVSTRIATASGGKILSRKALQKSSLLLSCKHLYQKLRLRVLHKVKGRASVDRI